MSFVGESVYYDLTVPIYENYLANGIWHHNSGKSYLAMWIAGQIAQGGDDVLYCDWELAGEDHRDRQARLFAVPSRRVHYMRMRNPLRDEMDRLEKALTKIGCQYAVFDSVGPASRASGGRFMDADLGQEYFGLVRRLNIGSLHVAHPPKNVDDEKDATIYGSAFFSYLARSVWYVQAADHRPGGDLLIGLYHHKLTTGAKRAPLAYRLCFSGERTTIESTDLKAVDELAAKLPLLDRLLQKLARGPMTIKALASDLDVPQPTVRKTLIRHASKFTKLDRNTVALVAEEERF